MSYPRHITSVSTKKAILLEPELFMRESKYAKKLGIWIILVNPSLIISKFQLYTAILFAWRDFIFKENRAKKFEIQVLLRLLGRTQITELYKYNPLVKGEKYIALIVKENKSKKELRIFTSLKFLDEFHDYEIVKSKELTKILKHYQIKERELEILARRLKDRKKALEMLIIESMCINYLAL